jgi:putative transposase
VLELDDQRYWRYAVITPMTNNLLLTKREPTRTNVIVNPFFTEFREKHDVDDALFLIAGVVSLKDVCQRHGIGLRYEQHGDRNSSKLSFIWKLMLYIRYKTFLPHKNRNYHLVF